MSAVVLVFLLCALACGVAHVAILLSTARGRTVAVGNVPRPRAIVELIWALLPVVALAIVLTATWARVRERDGAPPPAIMKLAR